MFAITGTPGVGKTAVAKVLQEKRYSIVDFNTIARYYGCIGEGDDIVEIDLDMLLELFNPDDFNFDFVEGHLSHYITDRCVVLRCRPDVLERRMREKGWGENKILENIEAEIIDYVLVEAMETCNEVHEIDTTLMSPKEVADAIELVFMGEKSFPVGSVDWIEELGDEVFRYLEFSR